MDSRFLAVAKKAAKAGGTVARSYFRTQVVVQTKPSSSGNHVDFFTKADVESEQAIVAILRKHFPDHRIVGEEGGTSGTSDYSWHIDPIDGTDNFVAGNPIWGVSVGLAYKNEPVVGVIYYPTEKKLYFAEKGKGAWKGKERLRCKKTTTLKDALVIVSSYFKSANIAAVLGILTKLAGKCHGIRLYGCALLNFTLIAEGGADVMVKRKLMSWDACAGTILVREAGGIVCNPDGSEWTVRDGPIWATTTRSLLLELQNVLA